MAPFNPNPNPVDIPNFLGLSKPISSYEGDKSSAVFDAGIADAITEGASGIDKTFKSVISKDAEKRYGDLQNQEISQLQNVDSALRSGSKSGQDLFASTDAPPASVKDGMDRVDMLEQAKKANGNLSPTYFVGQQYKVLKDLRSEYPGYTDYIDKESSRITGKHIANEYATSLISDANSYITQARAEKDKTLTQLRELQNKGAPDSDRIETMYRGGIASEPMVKKYIVDTNASDWAFKRKQQDHESTVIDRGDEKYKANDLAETLTTQGANTYFYNMTAGQTTSQQAAILDKISKGEPVSSEDAQGQVNKLMAAKTRAQAQMMKDLQDPKNGLNGKPLANILGVDAANKMVGDKLVNYDRMADLITNKEYGQAAASANAIKSITSDNKLALFKDVNMGRWWQLMDAGGQMGGPEVGKELVKELLSSGMSKQLTTMVHMQMLGAGTGLGNGPGTSSSLKGSIDLAQQQGLSPSDAPKTYSALISIVESIADPRINDKTKLNYAKYAFNPDNGGLIRKFELDGVDPVTKLPTPGQYSIFNRMTSSDITGELIRLRDEGHPEVWSNYKDWATQTFGRELFGNALRDFSKLQEVPGTIAYDNVNHRFIQVMPKSAAPSLEEGFVSASQTAARARSQVDNTFVSRTLNQINSGLYNISNIAKAENSDVNGYLLQTLQDLKAINPDNVKGLSQSIYDVVAKQKENQKTYEENLRKKYQSRKPE